MNGNLGRWITLKVTGFMAFVAVGLNLLMETVENAGVWSFKGLPVAAQLLFIAGTSWFLYLVLQNSVQKPLKQTIAAGESIIEGKLFVPPACFRKGDLNHLYYVLSWVADYFRNILEIAKEAISCATNFSQRILAQVNQSRKDYGLLNRHLKQVLQATEKLVTRTTERSTYWSELTSNSIRFKETVESLESILSRNFESRTDIRYLVELAAEEVGRMGEKAENVNQKIEAMVARMGEVQEKLQNLLEQREEVMMIVLEANLENRSRVVAPWTEQVFYLEDRAVVELKEAARALDNSSEELYRLKKEVEALSCSMFRAGEEFSKLLTSDGVLEQEEEKIWEPISHLWEIQKEISIVWQAEKKVWEELQLITCKLNQQWKKIVDCCRQQEEGLESILNNLERLRRSTRGLEELINQFQSEKKYELTR
ncbi:hypothetical protein [Calderihabitans maritimus]|uniref:Uncharacterized protein n=1 Tax=Calderihabitans maritimus TaxID=1246530 RepID=A0A1Z5HTJ6_9FIRM|nr:hypothetical protein [Calderihabitans maritimus]GAW92844.1 hypothetical protein KKC1_19930 [Calderihabitans maritimus]